MENADRSRGRGAFLLEVFIVVLGILIAFAVDASYDRLRANADRDELLQALRAEFTENRAGLAETIEGHAAIAASISLVTDSIDSFHELGYRATPPLVNSILPYYTFDPNVGVIQAMLNSGQLGLIRDVELQRLLSAWSSKLDNLKEEEGRIWVIRDRLRSEMVSIGFALNESEIEVVRKLDENSEFRNYLFFRRADENRALRAARDTQHHAELILGRLSDLGSR